jgi:hypothetical protein
MVLRKSEPDERNENVENPSKWIQRLATDLDNWTPPLDEPILKTAIEIRQNGYIIDYCDAVLVAHALLDPDANVLFTRDRGIHNSVTILEMVNKHRSGGRMLYIMSDP